MTRSRHKDTKVTKVTEFGIGVLGALVFVVSPALAAVWTSSGYDGFVSEKTEMENVTVSPEGTVLLAPQLSELASLDEASVWSVAEGPGRRIYAGTGNNARVYLVEPGSKPRVVFDGEDGEVLCATADHRGNVFFGTTPDGVVYRIAPGAEPRELYATGEQYVFDLLPGPQGELYCATGINGKLYRITPSGKAELIFTASQTHLTTLAWLVEGRELLVGTAPDGIVYRLKLGSGKPEVSVLYDTPLEGIRAIAAISASLVCIAANPGDDDNGEQPIVTCVTTDGVRRWDWDCPESTVFDILSRGSRILVATGNNGLLFELDSLGRAALFQKTTDLQLLCLEPGTDGMMVATAGTAGILSLSRNLARSGYVVVPPQDCDGPARFGRLAFRASVPAGTGLAFDTRSGSSEEPDSTWTPWQEAKESVQSAAGRFIQWRARLSSSSPGLTPRLEQVDLYYRIPNRPPEIGEFEIAAVPPDQAREGKAAPVRKVDWEVEDPESDSLVFEILFSQGANPDRWLTLAKDLGETGYELDTRTLPDGWCRFKLVASDRPSQPPDAALSTELISTPVLIDNTPPRITGISVDNGRLTFVVTDESSPIAGCRFSVDAGPWLPLEPADGIFDSREERFAAKVELPAGQSTVAVWASDAQGNTTAASRLVR